MQGKERGGLYPSGLVFEFRCEEHCSQDIRGEAFTVLLCGNVSYRYYSHCYATKIFDRQSYCIITDT